MQSRSPHINVVLGWVCVCLYAHIRKMRGLSSHPVGKKSHLHSFHSVFVVLDPLDVMTMCTLNWKSRICQLSAYSIFYVRFKNTHIRVRSSRRVTGTSRVMCAMRVCATLNPSSASTIASERIFARVNIKSPDSTHCQDYYGAVCKHNIYFIVNAFRIRFPACVVRERGARARRQIQYNFHFYTLTHTHKPTVLCARFVRVCVLFEPSRIKICVYILLHTCIYISIYVHTHVFRLYLHNNARPMKFFRNTWLGPFADDGRASACAYSLYTRDICILNEMHIR